MKQLELLVWKYITLPLRRLRYRERQKTLATLEARYGCKRTQTEIWGDEMPDPTK